ncbi:response regulator, partial [Enterobacter roggenkampii]|uniref:response regulator n=1 Tax=Enterobacter roggenkampii TaxID=1812935 RepID=UPI0021CB6A8E
MKPASVIIMDEHPIVRMSIEVLLQKNKNITVKLKSGDSHEVLDCIRNHPIDLVILDIELTGTDAFALLKRIRNLNKDIKVLFLSSKEGANKQVISSQADSLIKISRIWAD